MTKKQKIWLGIFLAMFILPEVLWSSISNSIYGLVVSNSPHFYRMSFLISSGNKNLLIIILLIQLIGLIGVGASVINFKLNNFSKFIILFFSVLIILIVLFLLYLVWATKSIGF